MSRCDDKWQYLNSQVIYKYDDVKVCVCLDGPAVGTCARALSSHIIYVYGSNHSPTVHYKAFAEEAC